MTNLKYIEKKKIDDVAPQGFEVTLNITCHMMRDASNEVWHLG